MITAPVRRQHLGEERATSLTAVRMKALCKEMEPEASKRGGQGVAGSSLVRLKGEMPDEKHILIRHFVVFGTEWTQSGGRGWLRSARLPSLWQA